MSVAPANLVIASGHTSTITLTLNATGWPLGDYYGDVTVSCVNAAPLHIPWWVRLSTK